jgi:phosphotransferase system HPr-like phosphotransfer protein
MVWLAVLEAVEQEQERVVLETLLQQVLLKAIMAVVQVIAHHNMVRVGVGAQGQQERQVLALLVALVALEQHHQLLDRL